MLQLLGVSHRTANAHLRGRLVLSETRLVALLSELTRFAAEVVILSTCNRLEVYSLASDDIISEALVSVARATDVPAAEIRAHAYAARGREVVEHLIQTAAGVDSLIIGESQILGQVRHAWDVARQAGSTGATLNTLFRMAVEAGKEIRSQTSIGHGTTSVAHAAVELARQELWTLAQVQAVLLGAGEMGGLAARHLRAAGVGRLTIINRTLARAEELALEVGADMLPLHALPAALHDADVVVTCVQTPTPLVTAEMVAEAMRQRPTRPLLLVDIALPRSIDPTARHIPGIRLYDLDDLQAVCERNRHARYQAAQQAQGHVTRWADHFEQWERERGAVEMVRRLRDDAEQVRQAEVSRALRGLPDLSERERQALEAMSRRLVNRLLHGPTVWLKQESTEDQRDWLAEMWLLSAATSKTRETRDDQHPVEVG